MKNIDLIVVGAGPSGLACAIEAGRRGLECLVIDKGSVADAIRRFPVNMTFFSTSELLEIGDIPFLSAGFRPTRVECVRYYQMVARKYGLKVEQGAEVVSLHRTAEGFKVVTSRSTHFSQSVVVATGYFDDPNEFPVPGSHLAKVHRYYLEPYEYSGLHVAVVGGRNSAVETALDLFRNGAIVTLIHRGQSLSSGVKYWILPDIENRIKAGEIRALFGTQVGEIRERSLVLTGTHAGEIPNDVVFVMIGYMPSMELLRSAGVNTDPETLGPVYNPKTMETNVPGIYVAGSIAGGKFNNKIFIENGRAHGNLIVDAIAQAR
jgi:thioredoxin reductase (NADPH)